MVEKRRFESEKNVKFEKRENTQPIGAKSWNAAVDKIEELESRIAEMEEEKKDAFRDINEGLRKIDDVVRKLEIETKWRRLYEKEANELTAKSCDHVKIIGYNPEGNCAATKACGVKAMLANAVLKDKLASRIVKDLEENVTSTEKRAEEAEKRLEKLDIEIRDFVTKKNVETRKMTDEVDRLTRILTGACICSRCGNHIIGTNDALNSCTCHPQTKPGGVPVQIPEKNGAEATKP